MAASRPPGQRPPLRIVTEPPLELATDHPDEAGSGLGFELPAPTLSATCERCGAVVEVPGPGKRFPVEARDSVVVNGDGPCAACGCERVRVRVGF